MANIAFNPQISSLLKTRYSFALSIIPLSSIFSSFGMLWLISIWLKLDTDTPIKEFENSVLWLVLFLIVMITMMLLFYIIGWLANAAICATVFGWNKTKIKRVYLHSEVPKNWLKGETNLDSAMTKQMTKWHEHRAKGMPAFVFRTGILGWGLVMFFAMAIVPAIRNPEPLDPITLLWQAGAWTCGGALFGFLIWKFSEKQYAKYVKDTPDFDPTLTEAANTLPEKFELHRFLGVLVLGAVATYFIFSNSPQHSSNNTAKILTETASSVNARLPMTLDEETVWIASSALDDTFTYTYQLPNYLVENIDINAFTQAMTPDIETSVCKGESMKAFRDLKAVVYYDYLDSAGELITQIHIDTNKCGQ